MADLTMSGQYFSLETMISEIYAKLPIRMMLLSHNSTHDVHLGFSLLESRLYMYHALAYFAGNISQCNPTTLPNHKGFCQVKKIPKI